MKKKEKEKKLLLNKTSIAILNPLHMSNIFGREGIPCPPPSEDDNWCGVEARGDSTMC